MLRKLGFWVILAVIIGVGFGAITPAYATHPLVKSLLDCFIKCVKWLVCPIIFLTVIHGMVGMGSLKAVGRTGVIALLYFEIMSTLALLWGMTVGRILSPGSGMNLRVEDMDAHTIDQYTDTNAKINSLTDVLKQAIPSDPITPFLNGSTLQVLFMALVAGFILSPLAQRYGKRITHPLEKGLGYAFRILKLVFIFSPVAAFSAMAFMVGKWGSGVLLSMAGLLGTMAFACIAFIFLAMGAICAFYRIRIFSLLRYIKNEVLLVFATSSSESALAPLMGKMKHIGIPEATVGLVIPAGYSFNLDGTSIYLSLAIAFIAHAFNIPLSFEDMFSILLVLLVTSKGAAGVTGSGFIVLASTLAAIGGKIPVACIAILLGVDKLNSEMRSVTNLIGNCVACIIVALWNKQITPEQINQKLESHEG